MPSRKSEAANTRAKKRSASRETAAPEDPDRRVGPTAPVTAGAGVVTGAGAAVCTGAAAVLPA